MPYGHVVSSMMPYPSPSEATSPWPLTNQMNPCHDLIYQQQQQQHQHHHHHQQTNDHEMDPDECKI